MSLVTDLPESVKHIQLLTTIRISSVAKKSELFSFKQNSVLVEMKYGSGKAAILTRISVKKKKS